MDKLTYIINSFTAMTEQIVLEEEHKSDYLDMLLVFCLQLLKTTNLLYCQ